MHYNDDYCEYVELEIPEDAEQLHTQLREGLVFQWSPLRAVVAVVDGSWNQRTCQGPVLGDDLEDDGVRGNNVADPRIALEYLISIEMWPAVIHVLENSQQMRRHITGLVAVRQTEDEEALHKRAIDICMSIEATLEAQRVIAELRSQGS